MRFSDIPQNLKRGNDLSKNDSSVSLPPLFIDLDGTLIRSDLLIEGLFTSVKHNPLIIFKIPFWLFRGKAHFKQKIAERAHINPALLPYNKGFLSFLYAEAAKDRELNLASASNEILARQVANYIGIFRKVLASDDKKNLVGKVKLKAILEVCGKGEFDYAGNAAADLSIWPHCRHAILVNSTNGVERAARKISNLQEVFDKRDDGLLPYLRSIRIHHWLKNLLLFVPLFTSHTWNDTRLIFNLFIGFLSFSFCASGGYLFNDFIDLESDRIHPKKCRRPIAGGDVSFIVIAFLIFMLYSVGLGIAAYLPVQFLFVVLLYIVFSLAYSFYIKKLVFIDVLTLAGLYTLRVIAGAIAIDVYLSFWLLSFSIFIFLSMALVKRCTELKTLYKTNEAPTRGRDYNIYDLDYLHNMGISSGYLSVLVLALYINSNEVVLLYSHPKVLWVLCPLILYWISRVWLKSGRDELDDDPLVFAMKDRTSWLVGILVALIMISAT